MIPQRWSIGPFVGCLAAAALFGASTPAAKSLVDAVGPVMLAGLLYAGAAVAVLPSALRRRRRRRASASGTWRLLGAAASGGILGPCFLLTGLSMAPAGSVSLWLTLETVATAVLARWWFREHLGVRGWISVSLVVVASIALSAHLQLGTAVAWVALACLAWGLDNNLTAVIDEYTPEQITLVKGATTAVLLIPVGTGLGGRASLPEALTGLGIGALGYGLSLVLYVAGAQQLGATRSQVVFSTAPLFGLAAAWMVLGEVVGWPHGLAAALMATALWLLHRENHEHTHQHEPAEHTHWHRHDDGHHDHGHCGSGSGWHLHEHRHEWVRHRHPHRPDLHHRHRHC